MSRRFLRDTGISASDLVGAKIFLVVTWSEFVPVWELLENCGGIPPPPRIFGIMELGRNSRQNTSFKELRY